ncbi:IQ calmodulin-binding motif containing 1, isoform CRA_e [Mus musculus]|jgi:hypothetical protein|nr:IQ calmodulin-binding motif containing 1, isoform CRA_e [Mus musculus]
MSEAASRELHAQAQERLQHYFMGRAIEERAQQHREALMAQISTNIEQLMSMLYLHPCFINGIPLARDVASKLFRRKVPQVVFIQVLGKSYIIPVFNSIPSVCACYKFKYFSFIKITNFKEVIIF